MPRTDPSVRQSPRASVRHIQWAEPRAYRRAIDNPGPQPPPTRSLVFAGTTFVVVLTLRGLFGLRPNPGASPPSWAMSVAVAAAIALVLAYLLPLFAKVVTVNTVIVSDKGVNCNTVWGPGIRLRYWNWDQVACCVSWTTTIEGSPRPVFSLMGASGETLETFALARTVDLEALRILIERSGRELRSA